MGMITALLAAILVFTYMMSSHVNREKQEVEHQNLHQAIVDENQNHWDRLEDQYNAFDNFTSKPNSVPHYMQGYWREVKSSTPDILSINESKFVKIKWDTLGCYRKPRKESELLYNSALDKNPNQVEHGVYIHRDRVQVNRHSKISNYHFTVREGLTLETEIIYREHTGTRLYNKLSSYDIEQIKFCG